MPKLWRVLTEVTTDKTHIVTLETTQNEIRHEYSKMKVNEGAWMEIHDQQMLDLTEEVA